MKKKDWIKNLLPKYYFKFSPRIAATFILQYSINSVVYYTPGIEYYLSCHVHDHAEESLHFSAHIDLDNCYHRIRISLYWLKDFVGRNH